MEICKIFLKQIDYENGIEKSEYLFEQIIFDNEVGKEKLCYNENGSLAGKTINDVDNDIVIYEDFNKKLKFTTAYIYDEDGNLIKEIELEETSNKLTERNYEVNVEGHVIRQEKVREGMIESIKFYYNSSEELIRSEHFTNGKFTKMELNDKKLYKNNFVCFDEKGQLISKNVHLFDFNGKINSISDYDGNDNLTQINALYFNEEGYTEYETTNDLIWNIFIEEFYEYSGPAEYSIRIEKYYVNMELVIENRYRFEYSGEE